MTREIELTQGKIALVDEGDYEKLIQYKWNAVKNRHVWYAVRCSHKENVVCMHRQILRLVKYDGKITDHINRDGLDNRRSNLRIVDRSGNVRNHRVHSHNKSGYNGVHWEKKRKRWRVAIGVNGKQIRLGRFVNIDGAIEARRQAELKYWGEARTT